MATVLLLRRFRRPLRALLIGIALLLCAVVIVNKRHEVSSALRQLDPGIVVLAFIPVIAATTMMMLSWRVLLADLGSPLPIHASARVFFLSQLGKYIPGSVWPLLAQVELGREHGVAGRRSGVVGVVAMVVSLLAGLVVAAVTLPLFSLNATRHYWWVFLAVPVLLAGLHPRLFNPMLARIFRLVRREPPDTSLTARGLIQSLTWSVAGWVCYGLQLWLLVRDLGVSDARAVPLAIGSFALAWAVGFVIIIAPAGAGAREAALVIGLAPVLKPGAALLVALISRMLLTAADLLLALTAVLSARRHRRTATAPAR
jgi:hypothetical protein